MAEGCDLESGVPATFSVSVRQQDGVKYQWQRWNCVNSSWDDIAGATSPSYTISSPTIDDVGNYRVSVSHGGHTQQSIVASLTLKPSITTQPTNQVAQVGGTVNFTVAATGTPPFTYTWYKKLSTGEWYGFKTNKNRCNTDTYTITNVALNHAGDYQSGSRMNGAA